LHAAVGHIQRIDRDGVFLGESVAERTIERDRLSNYPTAGAYRVAAPDGLNKL
jgi:hypothetical protein